MGILQPGAIVPHFQVTTVDGDLFTYATVWQRKNLLLVVLNASDAGAVRALGKR